MAVGEGVVVVTKDGSGLMLHLSTWKGEGYIRIGAEEERCRSLDSMVEERGVADANAQNDAVVGILEMIVKKKTWCSAYGLSNGVRGGVRSPYYVEKLSILFDSHLLHDVITMKCSASSTKSFFACSTSISLRRHFSSSPLNTISMERSYSLSRSMVLRLK